jgi:hypothetical protein
MRRRAARLPALGILVLSIGVAAFAAVFGLFPEDVVAESDIAAAGPGSWLSRPGAWQWDALTALGLAGALAAAFVAVSCFRAQRHRAVAGGAIWALASTALAALVWHASSNTGSDLVLWQLAGAVLLIVALAATPTQG